MILYALYVALLLSHAAVSVAARPLEGASVAQLCPVQLCVPIMRARVAARMVKVQCNVMCKTCLAERARA